MKYPAQSKALVSAALLTLASCAPSTRIVESWKAPGVSVEAGKYNKVLVIGLLKDETSRRVAEDRMAAFMQGRGIASYGYLGPDQSAINAEGMSAKMVKDGIDGVLIMRLSDKEVTQTYVPGTSSYYGGAWGYYGYAYPMYSSPGYVQTDHTYMVETSLYSLKHAAGPVWTCTTSVLNPTSVGTAVDDIMRAIYRKMREDGFVVDPPKQ